MTEECRHARIRTWIWQDDEGKIPGMWSCAECGHKFVPLDLAQETDAERWGWVVKHASVGFTAWDTFIRLPVYDADDTTITALVDRAMSAE
jgi:hypothetical protein